MRRWMAILLVVAGTTLVGCGSSGSDNTAACNEKSARSLTQNFITASEFDVSCTTVKTGVPFYFVNNDDTTHTVTTDSTSPEQFDAELPQKNSTYSHTFTKPGTYTITCKRHSESMTLIVT